MKRLILGCLLALALAGVVRAQTSTYLVRVKYEWSGQVYEANYIVHATSLDKARTRAMNDFVPGFYPNVPTVLKVSEEKFDYQELF